MTDWRPSCGFDALRLRARLYARIRAFFAEREVLEVETPVLSMAGNTDPNIASFHCEFSGRTDGAARTRWMRTSPEFALKRLLAAGVGDCYELGRVFRDGEAGGRHNPEFAMLEWYRTGWDHLRLAEETIALVRSALALVDREVRVEHRTFEALYGERLGIDPFRDDIETLRAALGEVRIDPDGLQRDDWLDLLMTHRLQPTFDRDLILVVRDWPASQCALAKIRRAGDARPDAGGQGVAGLAAAEHASAEHVASEQVTGEHVTGEHPTGEHPTGEHATAEHATAEHDVAERFELYLGPLELANGYHELTDAAEQRDRFARDLRVRSARGVDAPPMDAHLLSALAAGLPPCAGVALGVERLLMAMLGTDRIADTLAFDFARA